MIVKKKALEPNILPKGAKKHARFPPRKRQGKRLKAQVNAIDVLFCVSSQSVEVDHLHKSSIVQGIRSGYRADLASQCCSGMSKETNPKTSPVLTDITPKPVVSSTPALREKIQGSVVRKHSRKVNDKGSASNYEHAKGVFTTGRLTESFDVRGQAREVRCK